MNTQRVEGHTPPLALPLRLSGTGHLLDAKGHLIGQGVGGDEAAKIMHAVNNIERLEKVNEALVRACEELVNWAEHNAMWDKCGQSYYKAKAALSLAKEPA